MSDFIIPVVVVCCVAFLGITTGVACFLHHHSRSRPVRGVVLREDLAGTVPGRVVEEAPSSSSSAPASATAPRSRRSNSPPADSGALGDGDEDGVTTAEREVYNLSAAERRRRRHHNRRLNAEEARMAYPLRASGDEHPLDGTLLARLATFVRQWTQWGARPADSAERRGGDESNTPQREETEQPAPPGGHDDAPTEESYGRYLVAVEITLHETDSQRQTRRKARTPNDAESSSTADPFGGRTQRDWEALHSTAGIDYRTNARTPYLTPYSATH